MRSPIPGTLRTSVEAPRQVGMAAHGGDQPPELVGPPGAQALDVGDDDVAQALVADVLEACLQPRDVRFDLFDEGQLVAERIQARIGRLRLPRVEDVGAGGDQDGIDAVALGAPQVQSGEGADLQRLQDDDREAGRLQVPGDAPLVAAAGLDADAPDAVVAEPVRKALPAGGRVVDREGPPPPCTATSSLSLPVSIPAVRVISSTIFV